MLEIISSYSTPSTSPDWLNIAANITTIMGALIALFYWRRQYILQRASDKALSIMNKVKLLHYEIIFLRAPRFRNSNREKFTEKLLEEINELSKLCALINQDLIYCEYYLVKGKNLQKIFNQKINEEVLKKLRVNSNLLYSAVRRNDTPEFEKIKEFFVPETLPGNWEETPAGSDFLDNDFSKTMKENFKLIQDILCKDIIKENWVKRHIIHRIYMPKITPKHE